MLYIFNILIVYLNFCLILVFKMFPCKILFIFIFILAVVILFLKLILFLLVSKTTFLVFI